LSSLQVLRAQLSPKAAKQIRSTKLHLKQAYMRFFRFPSELTLFYSSRR
jgi:hypothetical protein